MKIIVCVKQVPDTSGKVAVNPDGTLDRASMPVITNHDDRSAVEAALRLKDEYGCKVLVVSMGPAAAEEMLRQCLAMGADEAYLISDRAFGGSDTFATSQIVAAAIHRIGVGDDDIILCGRQAIDGDTAQVGPQIAEKLGLPQITYAGAIELKDGVVVVRRMLEDGYMTIQARTPCLITCIKELNDPRYMTVSGVMESYEKPLTVLTCGDLQDEPLIEPDTIGLKGSPTNIAKSFSPPLKSAGVMLDGADRHTVASLVSRLTARHIL